MVDIQYLEVLEKIYIALQDSSVNWVVTGSLGMALQGVPVDVHDIDIQTDERGAYEIERRLVTYVAVPVRFSSSDRIRSHFGSLVIDGIKVEIMGDIQKRLDNQLWEEPVEIERYLQQVDVGAMRIPVLALAYECQAYRALGRFDKVAVLRSWLEKNRGR